MRTTIELQDEHRACLLEIAARRGEKGFSNVIAEAIEQYLVTDAENARKRQTAQALRGALTEDEADELDRTVRAIRESWR